MIGLVVVVLLLIAGFAYVLGRSITRPIGHAVGVAERVAAGQLDNQIEMFGNDEAVVLMAALKRMQGELKAKIEAEKKTARETLRIKVALDVTSNSVMVADPDGKIIYCNQSVLEMMRNAEADLRKHLPTSGRMRSSVPVSTFITGIRRISAMCWAHSKESIALKSTSVAAASRWLRVRSSMMPASDWVRLSKWRDRTAEVNIEQEVASIISAAAEGISAAASIPLK